MRDWLEELVERRDAMRDVATRNNLVENGKRKAYVPL